MSLRVSVPVKDHRSADERQQSAVIVITVTPLPEHCPVRGNALASGDAALDREAEDAILARLDRDDLWGWCAVRVRATWTAPSGRAWHGDAYLGCCSYNDEADWREPGGYHEQMTIEATEALYEALRADVAEAAEASKFLSTHPLTVV